MRLNRRMHLHFQTTTRWHLASDYYAFSVALLTSVRIRCALTSPLSCVRLV